MGLREQDAEDAVQEVFLRICRQEFLIQADRSKGKFRSLVLAVTRHVVAKIREYQLAGPRDRRREVPLDDLQLSSPYPQDTTFDRLWAASLIERAKERLKDDIAVQAVFLQLEGLSYRDMAIALSRTESEITNYIHRGKERLRKETEKLMREYAGGSGLPGEIGDLTRFI